MIDSWGGNLTGGDTPEHVDGAKVSVNLFSLLRAQPMLGSDFNLDHAKPGNNRAVILSHSLWQRRFAGDPNIVGRTIKLSSRNYTVVGVMGPGEGASEDAVRAFACAARSTMSPPSAASRSAWGRSPNSERSPP